MNYSKDIIEAVWAKAFVQSANDPNVFRKDYAGAWICKSQYNKPEMPYCWVIDRLRPVEQGGTDDISNLYPLFISNHNKKGANYPEWETDMSSDGIKNIPMVRKWHV